MVVNDSELARIRADISTQLLHDTADVQSRTTPSDGAGGVAGEVYTTRWTGPGKVGVPGGREAEHAQRLHHDASVTITLPYDAQVTADDRVAIGGRTFEVFHVEPGRTWDLVTRVQAVEVE